MKLEVHVDSRLLMRRLFSPLLLLALLTLLVKTFSGAFLQPPMRAVDGVQNLQDWAVASTGRVKLAGDWAFYPNQFLPPESITPDSLPTSPALLTLPGVWNALDVGGQPMPNIGHATLALHIKLPEAGNYLIKIPTLTNSYRLWVNGEAKVENPHLDSFSPKPRRDSNTRYIRFHAPEAEALLVFHVSNYQHRAGGIWESIYLAPSDRLVSLQTLPVARDLIIALLLLVTAVAALVLGMRRQTPALVFLALLALLMALRGLTVNERILFQVFEIYDWQWQQRLEHLILYTALPLLGLYLWCRDPRTLPDWLVLMTVAVVSSLMLIVFITEAAVFTHTTRIYQLLGMLLAFLAMGLAMELMSQRQAGGLRFLISVLVLVATGLNDILYDHHQVESIYLLHVGALAFAVLQLLLPKGSHELVKTLPNTVPLASPATIPEPQPAIITAPSVSPADPIAADAPAVIANAMQTALALWEQHTGTDKLELAERSRQWRVTNDNGSLKTRTLDKYLKATTVPARPRLNHVMRTLDYVAELSGLSNQEQQTLADARQALKALQQEQNH
ncbi:MAG: hypothetical protein LAT63_15340 [Marinobacter sp.]|nr:hypothetical protein [Marinobacter sp.]